VADVVPAGQVAELKQEIKRLRAKLDGALVALAVAVIAALAWVAAK
jgi:hypothetical protein